MLETERLFLLPITLEIIDALLVSNDFFYSKYNYKNDGGEYLNPSPEYLHKIRKRLVDHPEEYPLAVDYLIIIKNIKTIIGTVYFKSLPVNGISEIGYGMSPQYEGNGYMSEAVTCMLNYGKRNGITKVVADTTVNNVKSQNLFKRNGFKLTKTEGNILFFELMLNNETKLKTYTPNYKDLWFRQVMLADKETMSYNDHWGGTIDWTQEFWEEWYDWWIINNEGKRYYRYITTEDNIFIGEIAYHYSKDYKGHMANVIIYAKYRKQGYGLKALEMLCEEAKNNGVPFLYDDIAIDNPGISIFLKLGFKEVDRNSEIILLKKNL